MIPDERPITFNQSDDDLAAHIRNCCIGNEYGKRLLDQEKGITEEISRLVMQFLSQAEKQESQIVNFEKRKVFVDTPVDPSQQVSNTFKIRLFVTPDRPNELRIHINPREVAPEEMITGSHKMVTSALMVKVIKEEKKISLCAQQVKLLKRNKQALCSYETLLMFLRNEAKMLRHCLGERAICQVIDVADYVGHSKGNALEKVVIYVEHFPNDLEIYLYENDISSEETQNKCIVELFEILLALKRKGIAHKDIKIENILCRIDPKEIRLAACDLSYAQQINAEQSEVVSKDFFCSGRCVSPERFRFGQGYGGPNDPAGHASDLWSMGCAIFFLKTNTFPAWCFLTEYALIYSHLEDAIRNVEIDGAEDDFLQDSSEERLDAVIEDIRNVEIEGAEDDFVQHNSKERLDAAKVLFDNQVMKKCQKIIEKITNLDPSVLGNIENVDGKNNMELISKELYRMQAWLASSFMEDFEPLINLVPEGSSDNRTYVTLMADKLKEMKELMRDKAEQAWEKIPEPTSTDDPFISLVYKMLRPVPEERITPEEGLPLAMALTPNQQ